MASTIYQPQLLSNQWFDGDILTLNNKNSPFNNSYFEMGLPCMKMYKTITNW
jgi:hypothetical protein